MPFNAPSNNQSPTPLALVWLLAAAWILPGLLGHDPWKPDEAYTFGLIYSALKNGDWLVPMLAVAWASRWWGSAGALPAR